ncbi:MAG TPA: hypothetical protein VLB01_07975 [Thermodesulfobacteriota bacterium]|nr:hypothetical protein [Thermodesulfobacteriota bacterium]
MQIKNLIIAIFLNLLFLISAHGMTIEEAYRAIPHRQTTFNAASARMSDEEAAYLKEFFKLVDLAIVERIQTLAWLQTSGEYGASFEHYENSIDDLLYQFNALEVPKHLKNVNKLVSQAIREQKSYFQNWQMLLEKGQQFKFQPRHPHIIGSHQKLVQAYRQLMRVFPREDKHNHQAFFDHLCALDFI